MAVTSKNRARITNTRARARSVSEMAEASYQGLRHRNLFKSVQTYCLFIGYPRSGHSLVGSLLDAHPNVVIAHELNSLRYLRDKPVGRDGLFWLILDRDRKFTERGRRQAGYDYSVPNQWHGRFDRLLVVGDKKGAGSTKQIGRDPTLLPRLQRRAGVDVRIVHVVRNPFDNIATMSTRRDRTLESCANAYFAMCRTNDEIRRRDDTSVLDLRHEELIRRPKDCLAELCGFLGVDPTPDYLADCAGIVYASPHRSRTEVDWGPGMIEDIQDRMGSFAFLEGYSFD
jgi:hypothetical protein